MLSSVIKLHPARAVIEVFMEQQTGEVVRRRRSELETQLLLLMCLSSITSRLEVMRSQLGIRPLPREGNSLCRAFQTEMC